MLREVFKTWAQNNQQQNALEIESDKKVIVITEYIRSVVGNCGILFIDNKHYFNVLHGMIGAAKFKHLPKV